MSASVAAQKAAELLGGNFALAKVCGVSPQAVSQWVKGTRPISERRCVAIEKATKRAVTRQELRPDDWQEIWPELANPEGKESTHV